MWSHSISQITATKQANDEIFFFNSPSRVTQSQIHAHLGISLAATMAAKRRLALPEIDDRIIISFLDTNDCMTCMRVNSAWNSVALDKFLSRTFIFSEPQENENARSHIRLACLLQDPFAQEASVEYVRNHE